MKHLIKLLLVSVIFLGCGMQPRNEGMDNGKVETKIGDYTIRTIDSCEYIEYEHGVFDQRVYSLTHKGNCRYCKERNKR